MRIVSLTALLATGFALAACGGGDVEAPGLTLDAGLDTCGLDCPEAPKPVDNRPKPPKSVLPDRPPTSNNGNDVKLDETTGEETIAIEQAVIINEKDKLGLSNIVYGAVTDPVTNERIRTATISIDTKTKRNSYWPKPKKMELYKYGTNFYEADSENPGFPQTPSNGRGLGGKYEEFRELTNTGEQGTTVDEELQVWTWDHSYGAQYRDVTSGKPEGDHQAWSFGGKRTAAARMPTSARVRYNGQFASTAKTEKWVNTQDQRQTLSYNNNWMVRGDATMIADFEKNTVDATLQPLKWRGYADMNGANDYQTLTIDPNVAPSVAFAADPNINGFMYRRIKLRGTVTKDPVKGNSAKGDARIGEEFGYVTNSTTNPFRGAFFGPNADEFTGIFNAESVLPRPRGGNFPINADRRLFLKHSGVVNVKKQ
jgi:hypothetical protein